MVLVEVLPVHSDNAAWLIMIQASELAWKTNFRLTWADSNGWMILEDLFCSALDFPLWVISAATVPAEAVAVALAASAVVDAVDGQEVEAVDFAFLDIDDSLYYKHYTCEHPPLAF